MKADREWNEALTAFQKSQVDYLEAANTFVRRFNKGLPPDRWTNGSNGMEMVARGIIAQQKLLAMLNEVALEMFSDIVAHRSAVSKGLGPGGDG